MIAVLWLLAAQGVLWGVRHRLVPRVARAPSEPRARRRDRALATVMTLMAVGVFLSGIRDRSPRLGRTFGAS